MVPMKPVVRASLVDTVVERIRSIIEQGELTPGDRLPTESELGQQLGVSRTVVREAVSQLESLGLLTVQRGRGMFVGNWNSLASCIKLMRSAMAIAPKELLQFTEFRKVIECYAARRAAEQATPEDVAELTALCDEIDREGRNDLEAMQADYAFHRRLMAITGNQLMHSILGVVQEFALAAMVQTTPKPRDRQESRQRHRAIVDAIRSGDPDAAEKAMLAHMDRTAHLLQEIDRRQKRHRA